MYFWDLSTIDGFPRRFEASASGNTWLNEIGMEFWPWKIGEKWWFEGNWMGCHRDCWIGFYEMSYSHIVPNPKKNAKKCVHRILTPKNGNMVVSWDYSIQYNGMLLERIGKLAPHIFHIIFTKQDGKHRKTMDFPRIFSIPLWMFHNYLPQQGEQQNVS